MRIVRISTRIYPDYGGPAKQAYLLSKFCSEHNIKVTNIACTPKNIPYTQREIINKNFDVIYLPFHAPGVNSSLVTLILFFIRFFVSTFKELIKIIKKESVQLIHSHTPLPAGFIAFLFYKVFKVPYFYTIHGLDIPIPFLLKFDFNISVKNSKRTFTVSNVVKKLLSNKYQLSNVIQFPNGIETSNYFHANSVFQKEEILQNLGIARLIKKEDQIIAYIGYMFLPQKVHGMIDFLEGFSQFYSNLKEPEKRKIKLLYIGDGEFSYLLENKIKELDLEQSVFFLGKRDDIRDILAVSDLLALTSYKEGFPNVILEAMASKVPCLVSNAGDMELIVSNTGYVVKVGNIHDIEMRLHDYFSLSDVMRNQLKNEAFNRVKSEFDIKIVSKKLIQYYNLALN